MTDIQTNVVNAINTQLNNSSLGTTFYEHVVLRLDSLGYTVKETDSWSLAFTISLCEDHVKNSCNVSAIPDAYLNKLVDNVCGTFLKQLFSMGKLTDFDTSQAVKSISMGDTSMTFADSDATLSDLFDYLCQDGDLVCFRKLTW